MIGDKSCKFVALYKSPSQSQDGFETFSDNFEMMWETQLQNGSFLTTVSGDFNAKSGTDMIKRALKVVLSKVLFLCLVYINW